MAAAGSSGGAGAGGGGGAGGFLASMTSAVKSAAKTVSDSAQAAYASAKAAPGEVRCSGGECGRTVVVPLETFAWRCASCQTSNGRDDAECSSCKTARPGGLKYWVKCTACGSVTEVPFTQAAQSLKNAGRSAKTFVATSVDAAKKNYEYLKGHAEEFHCTTCDARLKNPNPPPMTPEELKENAGEGPDGAAAPAGEPMRIDKVECPVCHKVTDVPETNFGSKVAKASQSVKKAGTKAFHTVSRKKAAPCPVCDTSVEVPADQLPAPAAEAPAPPGAEGGAAAPAAPAAQATREVTVNLECPKCNTKFPSKVTV